MNLPTDLWRQDQVDTLLRMWAAGATATIIGIAVDMSRGAVCGKVHRLGLPARAKRAEDPEVLRQRRAKRKAQSAKRERERVRASRGGGTKAKPTIEPPPYLGMALVPFADLRDRSGVDTNQCRFIEGDASPWLACGNATGPGQSYCGHHHGIVYHKRGSEPRISDEERARRAIHMRRISKPATVAGVDISEGVM